MTREQFENIAKLVIMEMANYDRDCENCIYYVEGYECWECEYEKGGAE